jgi:predicted enzyme related to lactoylglutathione lyase
MSIQTRTVRRVYVASRRTEGGSMSVEPSTTEGIGRAAVLSDPTGALFGLYRPES